MNGKSVIVIHTKTPYHVLCCALIGDEGGKVCFKMTGACDVQSHSNVRSRAKIEAGIYLRTPRESITHYFLVCNRALFDSHRDAIADFWVDWCPIGPWP